MARNASHNHRRKLSRKCYREARKEAFAALKENPKKRITLQMIRQRAHAIFRSKVDAIVKAKEEALGPGVPLSEIITPQPA